MKKFYLVGLLAAGLAANAQTQLKPDAAASQPKLTTNKPSSDVTPVSPVVNKNNTGRTGTAGKGLGKNSTWQVVGETEFDRPTNASNYRRIIAYPDGKISVIWCTSVDGPSGGYSTRGSGYNHFNGTSWGAISKARIETARTGYPNFDYDPVGGSEIVLAHKATSTNSGGMILSRNGSIGSTSWSGTDVLDTAANVPGVLWPRTVVSGNYLIVIGSFTDSSESQPTRVVLGGVRSPQVYSRLNLTNNVWEVKNELLPGYDGTRFYSGGGDNYAIDAVGNNVAILMGGLTDDITLFKSADNGVTWTHTIIDSFPVPAFDFKRAIRNEITGELDTPFVSDGAMSVKLDASGLAHCFWGVSRSSDADSTDNSYFLYPGQQRIGYWYEGRPDSIVVVGFPPDLDNDGALNVGSPIEDRVQYGNLGVTTAPYAVMSGDSLYVVYQTRTDNDVDGQGFGFTDIYLVTSTDRGLTWSEPLNLTSMLGFNTEQTFPSLASDCSSFLHLTFMHSTLQGFYDANVNAGKTGPYEIVYYKIPVGDVFSRNLTGLGKEANNLFSVNQNFPNPFSGATTIPVKLNRASDVKISIMNLVGQTVYSNHFENNPAGVSNFELHLNIKPGIYLYTVEAGDFKETRKMIVE